MAPMGDSRQNANTHTSPFGQPSLANRDDAERQDRRVETRLDHRRVAHTLQRRGEAAQLTIDVLARSQRGRRDCGSLLWLLRRRSPAFSSAFRDGRYWARPSDPQLVDTEQTFACVPSPFGYRCKIRAFRTPDGWTGASGRRSTGSPFCRHPPELSRVVSRTGPQGAWLSQTREVSKIARGR